MKVIGGEEEGKGRRREGPTNSKVKVGVRRNKTEGEGERPHRTARAGGNKERRENQRTKSLLRSLYLFSHYPNQCCTRCKMADNQPNQPIYKEIRCNCLFFVSY